MKTKLLQKLLLPILMMAACINLTAQDYELNFAGSGEYDSVESVLVENLNQGTSLTIDGGKILHLVKKVDGSGASVNDVPVSVESFSIYPNPSEGQATLSFSTPVTSPVNISVLTLTGSMVMAQTLQLEGGEHFFSLPAQRSGVYLVSVKGNGFQGVAKWICLGANGEVAASMGTRAQASGELKLLSSTPIESAATGTIELRSDAERVQMQYNDDDILRLTARKGNCTTILMKRPRSSFEVNFHFIPCTDANGKHYAIVKVGDLMWMAEDLTATRKTILVAESQSEWAGMDVETAGMAYYGYKEANKDQGTYYNYRGALAALPEGWRLPSAGEVQDLVKQLKLIGSDPATLLKAKNNDSWNIQSKETDETSFGAEANGNINAAGAVVRRGTVAAFWTKNKSAGKGYPMEIGSGLAELVSLSNTADLTAGYAVRGVADAPSAYNKLLELYFGAEMRASLRSDEDEKLLGDRYVITEEYKDEILFKTGILDELPMVRQAVGQVNEDGTESPVMVTFGNNSLKFLIYNDDLSEKLDTKSVTVNANSAHAESDRHLTPLSSKNMYLFQATQVAGHWRQWESDWDMQVISKDLTGDGVGDFVVAVYNKIVVVDGASFEILTEKSFTVSYALRIVLDDVKGVGSDQLYVLNGAVMEVYDNPLVLGNDFTYELLTILFDDATFKASDMAVGEVMENGVKNIIFSFRRPSFVGNRYLCLLKYDSSTSRFVAAHKQVISTGFNNNVWLSAAQVILDSEMMPLLPVRFRGRAYPADLVTGCGYMRYNANTQTMETTSHSDIALRHMYHPGANTYSYFMHYRVNPVVGNFDKNEEGKEQLKYIDNLYYGEPSFGRDAYYYPSGIRLATCYIDDAGAVRRSDELLPTASETNLSFFRNYHIVGANTTGRSRVLEYKSKTLSFSEPRIHALLAAPPYHGDYNYSYDMGTSWGKSSMTGKEGENSNTVSGSVIFGFEMEFNAPIVGTKIGGIDFTTKLTSANTSAFSQGQTLTKSNTFTTWYEDAVVLTAIPYETFTYTIQKSYNEDEVGSDIVIAIPKAAQTLMITLNDFEELTAADPKTPNMRSLFKHTVGKPFTYPSVKSQITSNADNKFIYYGGSFEGNEFVNIGSGGNLAREISLEKDQAESSSSSFAMEMELVATMFGVKAGGGFGYENSNTSTSKIGEGHTVAGIVAGLNKYGDKPEFKWNVVWFNYKLGGQTFPVVYYIVQQ